MVHLHPARDPRGPFGSSEHGADNLTELRSGFRGGLCRLHSGPPKAEHYLVVPDTHQRRAGSLLPLTEGPNNSTDAHKVRCQVVCRLP